MLTVKVYDGRTFEYVGTENVNDDIAVGNVLTVCDVLRTVLRIDVHNTHVDVVTMAVDLAHYATSTPIDDNDDGSLEYLFTVADRIMASPHYAEVAAYMANKMNANGDAFAQFMSKAQPLLAMDDEAHDEALVRKCFDAAYFDDAVFMEGIELTELAEAYQ